MIKWIIQWYQKFTFHNVFSFQKLFSCKKSYICWLDVIRLGSFGKTNNTDRNGLNNPNTHTHTHIKYLEEDSTGKG